MLKPANLTEAILKVCPIDGIDCKGDTLVRIRFLPSATEQQKAAAHAVAKAFDWNSPTAEELKREEIKALVLADGTYTAAEMTKVLNYVAKRALGLNA